MSRAHTANYILCPAYNEQKKFKDMKHSIATNNNVSKKECQVCPIINVPVTHPPLKKKPYAELVKNENNCSSLIISNIPYNSIFDLNTITSPLIFLFVQ